MSQSTMTARERVWAAINLQPVDRVPTDIWATPEIWQQLDARFGGREAASAALHLDGISGVYPACHGPPNPPAPEGEISDFWGIRSKPMQFATGVYYEL